jgi:hypothetical protein
MEKFKWTTPGILEQVNNYKNYKYPELTLKMLQAFIDQLEAESDCKVSKEFRDEIWRKIRLGTPLEGQEHVIHEYDKACFEQTGKWN